MIRAVTAPLIALVSAVAMAQTATVVNITPAARSGEAYQDSEPTLAVDPNNPARMLATTITNDPNFGDWAPIYYSLDGGATWAVASMIPSAAGAPFPFVDPSLSFSPSGAMYAAILRAMPEGPGVRPMSVLRKMDLNNQGENFTDIGSGLRSGIDQPSVQSTSAAGGDDRSPGDIVLVGNDNLQIDSCPMCRTATVDQYINSSGNFLQTLIESRCTSNDDGAPIRITIDPGSNRVYGAFLARRDFSNSCPGNYDADIVVVRDDSAGASQRTFAALTDPNDNLPGIKLTPKMSLLPRNQINGKLPGQDRFGSDLAVAVDPTNPDRVYIAWADLTSCGGDYLLHLRRSNDKGATWSGDLGAARSFSKNPALAVNNAGTALLLYQQWQPYTNRWITQFERSVDNFATSATVVLSNSDAVTPQRIYQPYLGDYTQVLSIGKDFYGIFSASNYPDRANFPSSVSYQRSADFDGHTLTNTAGAAVAPSIDPFFFKVTEP